MRWTTEEIRYLEEHAHEGTVAVGKALGRSPGSVQIQASRYGVSMQRRWQCPRCGAVVGSPLSTRTGWCKACTKAERSDRIEEEVRELRDEVERNRREDRRRQALYSRKSALMEISNQRKSCENKQLEGQETGGGDDDED